MFISLHRFHFSVNRTKSEIIFRTGIRLQANTNVTLKVIFCKLTLLFLSSTVIFYNKSNF